MQTIGIVGDTHSKLNDNVLEAFSGDYLPDQVFAHLDIAHNDTVPLPACPCDIILHAGDIGYADTPAQWILDALQDIAPVIAVAGNCDYPDNYVLNGIDLPLYATFEVEGVSFAMLHTPADLNAAVWGRGVLTPAYIKPVPDVLIHGHTHELKIDSNRPGILTLSPGSPSKPHDGYPSVMIMKVEGGKILSVDAVRV